MKLTESIALFVLFAVFCAASVARADTSTDTGTGTGTSATPVIDSASVASVDALTVQVVAARTSFEDFAEKALFLLQCVAFGVGWVAGCLAWLLLLRSKDEREFF